MVSKKGAKKLCIIGVIMAIGGFLISATSQNDMIERIGGIVGALGCGVMGGYFGVIRQHKYYKENPSKQKEMQIELKDERSNLIRTKAAAKAGNITTWLILGVAYLFIILDYPLWLVFLILGIFLLKTVLEIIFIKKYNNEF
ncbi:MAG: hypothetical protein ACRC30_02205 [Clostridium sp.]